MPESPAGYLAQRVCVRHDLTTPAAPDDLLRVAAAVGATVLLRRLSGRGYYLDWPDAAIVLRRPLAARILAHELYHHLIADNAAHGVTYEPPEWVSAGVEADAEEFAAALAGP